jgi:hypothetical protein
VNIDVISSLLSRGSTPSFISADTGAAQAPIAITNVRNPTTADLMFFIAGLLKWITPGSGTGPVFFHSSLWLMTSTGLFCS